MENIKEDKVVVEDSPITKKDAEIETPNPEDTDFDKELEALENGSEQSPAPKPAKTELEKAVMTGKSIAKRIKSLGGDPTELISDVIDDTPPTKPERTEVDTSQFVTKLDLAEQEAQKIAKSPSELKLIMWWVKNKGMSVEDAHLLANKGKLKKVFSEVDRTRTTVPANPGGGAGQRPADNSNAPALPDSDRRRLEQSGMVYDPAKKAYVGKKVQHRYDEVSKQWITEKI